MYIVKQFSLVIFPLSNSISRVLYIYEPCIMKIMNDDK